MKIRYMIDAASSSYLGVCREPRCGARALSATKAEALRRRREHLDLVHAARCQHQTRRPEHDDAKI